MRLFSRTLSQVASDGLPYRIRAPLAKLKAAKALPDEVRVPGALGDGEALEAAASVPDYLRLALTSRVYDFVSPSPLVHAAGLSEKLGAVVHIKREDLNQSHSFYIRGAFAKLADLKAQGCREVITVSIGSRGHALACAARRLGMGATIVMPEGTPVTRQSSITRKGGKVVLCGTSMSEAQAEAARLVASSQGTEHELMPLQAHDDPLVIAGNATVGIEVARQHGSALKAALQHGGSEGPALGAPQLDAVFVPVGGGSLLAGIAAAVKQISPGTRVIGVEPMAVDVMRQSLLSGYCVQVQEPGAEGIWVKKLGPEVFRLCDTLVDDVVVVSDAEISQAIRDAFEDTRALLEPAGAISIAGLTKWKAQARTSEHLYGGSYVAIASDACNIEFDFLKEIVDSNASDGATFVRIGELPQGDT